MFREGVLAFLGVKEKGETGKKDFIDDYCYACKFAKKNDCENCSRDIKILNN